MKARGTTIKPSLTAQIAAAHRAYHLMQEQPALLEDSVALWLLGPPSRAILKLAPLRWLFFGCLLARFRPIRVWVVVRSRYAEDCLERRIRDGCRQYLILGAGLDSWALRHESPGIRVFELDHPATQRWKEARIRSRLGKVPAHLALIPIDFERQTIADVLDRQDFDRESPAFVSWLGTIYYLTPEGIETTLASLARCCAPGSRIVFDYFLPKSAMSPADRRMFEEIDRGGTRRGEPLRTLLDPEEVASLLRAAGFRVVEDLSAAEVRRRYLRGRSDGLDVPDFGRLCCAESGPVSEASGGG